MDNEETRLKEYIGKAFVETGEKQKLYQKLKDTLTEIGWTENIKKICQEELTKREDRISAEDLTKIVFSKAEGSIPESVKTDMLQQVHSFVDKYC